MFGKKPAPEPSGPGLDPKTGLPELPEGHHWEVSTAGSSGYLVTIWRGRRRMQWTALHALSDADIASAARTAHRAFLRYQRVEMAEKRLLGCYPPNKLEVN